MKRTLTPLTGLATIALVAACTGSGVQIETRPTVAASAASTAAAAAADERDAAGRAVRRMSVSVLPFDVATTDTTYGPLGYGFAELLLTDLAVSHRLMVVDRMRVDDVRRELSLSSQGATDKATALRLGRTIAAQDLVLGALTLPPDSSLRFETNVADVATGQVAVALSGRGSLDQMFDAERQLVMKLFEQLGVKLTPAELTTLDQSPRTSTKAFLAYSSGVQAESRGDLVAAQAAYDRAIVIDPKFVPAVQHRAAVVQRATKSANAGAAQDATRLDVRADTARETARLVLTPKTSTGKSGAAAASAAQPVATPATPTPAAQLPATPAASTSAPSFSRSSGTVTGSATSASVVTLPSAVPSTPASTTPTPSASVASGRGVATPSAGPAKRTALQLRRDSINRVRRDSVVAANHARQDSIIAVRRAARRDSVLAAARHRADSTKAKRGAKVAAKRDSTNSAAVAEKPDSAGKAPAADKSDAADNAAARKSPAHKEPPLKTPPRRPPRG